MFFFLIIKLVVLIPSKCFLKKFDGRMYILAYLSFYCNTVVIKIFIPKSYKILSLDKKILIEIIK